MYKIGECRKAHHYLAHAIWGAVFAIDFLAFSLVITLFFNSSSVMYMLMDTISVVWKIAIIGAILGISFGLVTKTQIKLKSARLQSGLSRLSLKLSLALPTSAVKRLREGK
jgi:ABC-type phosphate/phosphonate transport system permease subunit